MIRPRLTIGFKILSGFMLSALFVAVVGYVGFEGNRKIENAFKVAFAHNVPQVEALSAIKSVAYEIEIQTISFEFTGKETSQTEGSFAGQKKSELLSSIEKIDRWIKEYKALIPLNNPDELTYIDNIKDASETIVSSSIDLLTLKEHGIYGKPIEDKINELAKGTGQLKEVIHIALQEELKHLDEQNKIATKAAIDTIKTSIIVTIGAFLFSLIFGFFVSRLISKNIRKVRDAALEISSGNFRGKILVRSKDEIGELATAFNTMADRLQETRQKVNERTQELEKAKNISEEKAGELERMNKFMVNRELKMVELKKEIEDLKKRLS